MKVGRQAITSGPWRVAADRRAALGLETIERGTCRGQESGTRFGQLDAPVEAAEQPHTEMRLEGLHLPADGAMREIELARGRTEAQRRAASSNAGSAFKGGKRRLASRFLCDFSSHRQ